MDSRLLVRIDALLGLVALAVVLGGFYLVTVDVVVGVIALAAIGAGLYALSSYARGFLVGAADPQE